MTDWIRLQAGSEAYQQIQENGLKQQDVGMLLGASGGPKWFVLQGIDQFLFGEFFKDRKHPLDLLGTSAGAWRFASLGQPDSVAASNLFAELYSSQTYSAKPDVTEITEEARALLHKYIPDDVVPKILQQETFRHHFIAVRCRGLVASERKLQLAGLLTSAVANGLNRKWLGRSFERVLFHHPKSNAAFSDSWNDFKTHKVPLSTANFKSALLATGSIPMVLQGVRDIPGAPPGIYRDGGITDYHFDIDLGSVNGLVLYPHFHNQVIPGWFDKHLPWRRTLGTQWPKTVLLTPTDEFLARLPFGKIPDRKDFATLSAEERYKYWRTAIDQGKWLADQLQEWIATGKIREKVRLWQ